MVTGGIGGNVTVPRFEAEVARHLPDCEVVEGKYGGLTVKWRGQPSKDDFMDGEKARRDVIREGQKKLYGERGWYDEMPDEIRAELECRPYSALGPAEVKAA
jgi:hypothetical protein